MLHLLNLLAAIALLVWGTHIVRTGDAAGVRREPAPGAGDELQQPAARRCSPASA